MLSKTYLFKNIADKFPHIKRAGVGRTETPWTRSSVHYVHAEIMRAEYMRRVKSH